MAGLILCASLWSLWRYPRPDREWTMERKLEAIRTAGFPAVSGPPQRGLTEKASGLGLRRLAAFIAPDADRLKEGLDLCGGEHPERVNIQIGTPDQNRRQAGRLVALACKWADERRLKISFETHRGTAMETPDKLRALADDHERETGNVLPVTWDFSHHAVVRQIPSSAWPEQLLEEKACIQAADWFHLRPHSAHHVQVPVIWRGKESAETRAWLPFAREAMRVWRSAPVNRRRELFVTPELGPRGDYALQQAPPVWPEVLALSGLIEREWREAGKKPARKP